MRNLLIIANEFSNSYFNEVAKLKYPKLNNQSIAFITSKKKFEGFDFKKKKYNEIWVLVELCWDSLKTRQGYDITLSLLEEPVLGRENLKITFFSLLNRKQLLEITSDEKNIFPKAFNHYQLPIQDINLIETKQFDLNSYNFIRNYALSKSNIIGDIIHRLETVLHSKNIASDMVPVIKRLKAIRNILNPEIIKLIDIQYSQRHQIRLLHEKLIELENSYLNINRNSKLAPKKKMIRTAIILEDNIEIGGRIKDWLKPYCDDVIYCRNGDEAKSNIKAKGSSLDLLFCDLELLNKNGFWQEIQGVQVLDYLKQEFPNVFTVVLSAFPTQAVNILLPERSHINKHVRKKELFHSDTSMDTILNPILKSSKIFSKRFAKGFSGPSIGKLKLIRERYFGLKFSDEDFSQSIIREINLKANLIYDAHVKGDLESCVHWSSKLLSPKNNNIDDIWDKLPVIMGIRRMILKFILESTKQIIKVKGNEAYFFDYTNFKEPLPLNKLPNNLKTFIQTHICFNVVNLDNYENKCYIILQNLFTEEEELLDTLKDIRVSDPILEYESFKKLKVFMTAANEVLQESFFDFSESLSQFEFKLSKLATILKTEQKFQKDIINLCQTFPFTPSEIPSVHSSLKKATAEFLILEEEFDI